MFQANINNQKRIIPLQGTRNFRDLGGYPTADGRSTRWGCLFRSDRLHRLTRNDQRTLQHMNIHTLVDFRPEPERLKSPNRLSKGHNIHILTLPVNTNSDPNSVANFTQRIKTGKVDGLDADQILTRDYRNYVSNHTAQYRQYIHALLDAAGQPFLFHCTAGKDRTGFAAAVTLRLVGVPNEIITADYLLTNSYFLKSLRFHFLLLRLVKGKAVAKFAKDMATAKEIFLNSAYQAINNEFGSFENYVRLGLELGEKEIKRLRDNLLE
jgi:protein-tyrosine phosphatase